MEGLGEREEQRRRKDFVLGGSSIPGLPLIFLMRPKAMAKIFSKYVGPSYNIERGCFYLIKMPKLRSFWVLESIQS